MSCPTHASESLVCEFLDNAGHRADIGGAGDGPSKSEDQVKADIVDEVQKAMEEDDFHDEKPGRFVSILERRRMDRKIEEEKEIVWKPLEKVEDELVAKKVENLISKLKNRFSEEKEARKRAVKQNPSYFEFCNSVDAFLRHIEKPKVEIKFSERDSDVQVERLFSFGVRPVSVKRSRKNATSHSSNDIATKEIVEEENKEDKNSSKCEKKDQDLLRKVKESIAPIDYVPPPREICTLPVTLKNKHTSKLTRQVMSPGDFPSKQQADDICHIFPTSCLVFNNKEYKPFESTKFTPVRPFLFVRVPGDMPMFCIGSYPKIMSSRVNYLDSFRNTNPIMLPFRGGQMCDSIFNCVPLKRFNNYRTKQLYTGLYPMSIVTTSKKVFKLQADDNINGFSVIPVFCVMPVNGGFGIFTLKTVACLRTEQRNVLDSYENVPSKQRNLPRYEEIPGRFLPVVNYRNKYHESKLQCFLTPSPDVKHAPSFVTASADDSKLTADDNQTPGYERIIDVSEDVGPFGIMSVYCNSEIHSR